MPTQAVELPVAPATLLTRCVDAPYLFGLDGGSHASWGEGVARLAFGPRAVLRVAADGTAQVVEGTQRQIWRGDPFALLDRFCAEFGTVDRTRTLASGGIVAALSYDLRCFVERLSARPLDPPILLHAAAYDWLLTYSYIDGTCLLSSEKCSPGELRDIANHLAARAATPEPIARSQPIAMKPVWSRHQYQEAVHKALEYIAAGDIYQVNLAQAFIGEGAIDATRLFRDTLRRNAVPYAAYLDLGDCQLVSNSPECLFSWHDATLSTFPIKGTRPRGADPTSDADLAAGLRLDVKERAEHVMIVDLERNDLGRICKIGSVRVDELAQVCTFPGLHHMVSTVRGELPAGTHLSDLLRALFPGGSITGAPKVRAMQIIDELEAMSRGFYTGGIGFLADTGVTTFNLAIRTAVVASDKVVYQAGGGIVADSSADREYAETILKSQPFLEALKAGVA